MTVPSNPFPITIQQGATFTLSGTWTLDDGTTPITLVGYTCKFQIRDAAGNLVVSASSYGSADDTDGVPAIVLGGSAGTYVAVLPETITQLEAYNPTSGRYSYGLSVKSAGGLVTLLLGGPVQLVAGVVQWP
jgi:hypothetical protein